MGLITALHRKWIFCFISFWISAKIKPNTIQRSRNEETAIHKRTIIIKRHCTLNSALPLCLSLSLPLSNIFSLVLFHFAMRYLTYKIKLLTRRISQMFLLIRSRIEMGLDRMCVEIEWRIFRSQVSYNYFYYLTHPPERLKVGQFYCESAASNFRHSDKHASVKQQYYLTCRRFNLTMASINP